MEVGQEDCSVWMETCFPDPLRTHEHMKSAVYSLCNRILVLHSFHLLFSLFLQASKNALLLQNERVKYFHRHKRCQKKGKAVEENESLHIVLLSNS